MCATSPLGLGRLPLSPPRNWKIYQQPHQYGGRLVHEPGEKRQGRQSRPERSDREVRREAPHIRGLPLTTTVRQWAFGFSNGATGSPAAIVYRGGNPSRRF